MTGGPAAHCARRPRAAPPTGGPIKAGRGPGADSCEGLTCGRCYAERPGEDAHGAGRCARMLRERTVRLQYGSRVEAVYVLGTHLWTDVYR